MHRYQITSFSLTGVPERSIDSLLDDGIRDQDIESNSAYQELATQKAQQEEGDGEDVVRRKGCIKFRKSSHLIHFTGTSYRDSFPEVV